VNLYVHDFRREAISCFQQAAALDPKEFRWPYYCGLALSEDGSPEALDALAAAYAENRQLEAAVQTAQQAQPLAVAEGQRQLAHQIQARVQLYISKQPHREVVHRGEK